jgi:hypothetical protein
MSGSVDCCFHGLDCEGGYCPGGVYRLCGGRGPDGFAPDGTLFVAVGDNAKGANAQTLTTRLGKLLRITTTGGIPTDNQAGNSGTSTVQVTAR